MCLLAKEVPHEDYKRDPVSMKDQDSLWIINPLNWYYKFSKSIVISVFYPFLLLLLSTQSLRRLCQTSRHLTLPFQPGRTDSVHVRPTPCLRGLNNLSNLRLYDTPREPAFASPADPQSTTSAHSLIIIDMFSYVFVCAVPI